MTSKCNIVFWVGNWDRKRTSVEKLKSTNKVGSVINSIIPIAIS